MNPLIGTWGVTRDPAYLDHSFANYDDSIDGSVAALHGMAFLSSNTRGTEQAEFMADYDFTCGLYPSNFSEAGSALVRVISDPVIVGQSFGTDENQVAVGTVVASDPDLVGPLSFYDYGGRPDDTAFFDHTADGELSFNVAPDFENPTDIGGESSDNTYLVEVRVEDSVVTSGMATMAVTVYPVNDNAPVFTSPTTVNIMENISAVQVLSATDGDVPSQAITFSITGNGADDGVFRINGSQLEFVARPDFESPQDANGDNVYEVEVAASDDGGLTTFAGP